MGRARAHRRLAGVGSFALLALVAELAGRSLTLRLDLGRHVPTPSYGGADYYPFLLAGVKVAIALMLATLTWRFFRARAAARAARAAARALKNRHVNAASISAIATFTPARRNG